MTKSVEGAWDWKKEIDTNEFMSPIQKQIIVKLHDRTYEPFKLNSSFVNKYAAQKAPFRFNGFGELVYMRTYSRLRPDGFNEQWYQSIERVVNGTYNIQKRHIVEQGLGWDDYKAQQSAQEMFDRMYHMKFLPPGRGLWAMGSELTEERGLYAALNNCGFVSTENIKEERSFPFRFLMDMSMLGVGVGFDTLGKGKMKIVGPDRRRRSEYFDVPDTREGWVESVARQIDSYLLGTAPLEFGYDAIRERGLRISGFGGKTSGPEPLIKLHKSLDAILTGKVGEPIDARTIVDIQNLIGGCVVAGNVRRTAEIALGDDEDEFLDLKNYNLNPERAEYGWASNNSLFAILGMNYGPAARRTAAKGEPGFQWMENARAFGRMMDPRNDKDKDAKGVNPCVEQTLFDKELCTLVETFPEHHKDLEDFKRTLKFAYLYAKTVTLGRTHVEETNRVMQKNRRIGASMSGIQQFVENRGISTLIEWSKAGYDTIQTYDKIYSEWMAVRPSIKTTSIKPSGTVSLLAGSTAGMHWPISRFALRRMKVSKNSDLVGPLRKAGYDLVEAIGDENSLIVEAPLDYGEGIRGESEVPMREQLEMAATLQHYWSDNQVSSTIKFHPGLTVNRKIRDREVEELKQLSEKKEKSPEEAERFKELEVIKFRSEMPQETELQILKERLGSGDQSVLERIIELEVKSAKKETDQIETALNDYQYRLKGISFLPIDDAVYEQAPFEEISEERYYEMSRKIKPIDFTNVKGEKNQMEAGCTSDVCEIKLEKGK